MFYSLLLYISSYCESLCSYWQTDVVYNEVSVSWTVVIFIVFILVMQSIHHLNVLWVVWPAAGWFWKTSYIFYHSNTKLPGINIYLVCSLIHKIGIKCWHFIKHKVIYLIMTVGTFYGAEWHQTFCYLYERLFWNLQKPPTLLPKSPTCWVQYCSLQHYVIIPHHCGNMNLTVTKKPTGCWHSNFSWAIFVKWLWCNMYIV